MKIEIKNVKINQHFSRETLCYTASLYVDGKRIGTAENDGGGGPDLFIYKDKEKGRAFEAYCRSLPPTPPSKDFPYELPMCPEQVIGQLIEKWDLERQIKKMRKGHTVFRLKTDPEGSYRKFKGNYVAAIEAKAGDQLAQIWGPI